MPSIIPSYVYTLFASLIVGTIVVSACSLSTLNVKTEAENQQLTNITEYVATESIDLISHATSENLTSTLHLNVPQLIGSKIYWIQIANDSARTWVEAGFGTTAHSSGQRTYIPLAASASGTYTSSSGAATLECYSDSAGIHLTLAGGS